MNRFYRQKQRFFFRLVAAGLCFQMVASEAARAFEGEQKHYLAPPSQVAAAASFQGIPVKTDPAAAMWKWWGLLLEGMTQLQKRAAQGTLALSPSAPRSRSDGIGRTDFLSSGWGVTAVEVCLNDRSYDFIFVAAPLEVWGRLTPQDRRAFEAAAVHLFETQTHRCAFFVEIPDGVKRGIGMPGFDRPAPAAPAVAPPAAAEPRRPRPRRPKANAASAASFERRGIRVAPPLEENEVACSDQDLRRHFRDGADCRLAVERDPVLGDPEKSESDRKTVRRNGVSVVFHRRAVGNWIRWAFAKDDLDNVALLFPGFKKAENLPRANPADLACNPTQLKARFKTRAPQIIERLRAKLGDPETAGQNEMPLVRGEIAVTATRKTLQGKPYWTVPKEEAKFLPYLLELEDAPPAPEEPAPPLPSFVPNEGESSAAAPPPVDEVMERIRGLNMLALHGASFGLESEETLTPERLRETPYLIKIPDLQKVLKAIFVEGGIFEADAEKLSFVLSRMKPGSLEMLEILGVLGFQPGTRLRERSLLALKSGDSIARWWPEDKQAFADRFRKLIADYREKLTPADAEKMMGSLIPVEVLERLAREANVPVSRIVAMVTEHPDFPQKIAAHRRATEGNPLLPNPGSPSWRQLIDPDPQPPAGPNRDVKGFGVWDADTNPIIADWIRRGEVMELSLDGNKLKLYRVREVENYATLAAGKRVRVSLEDVTPLMGIHFKDPQALWRIAQWLVQAQAHIQSSEPVRLRFVKNRLALSWKGEIDHSHVSHAGAADKTIYLGQRLLEYLFAADSIPLRVTLLDNHELRHLADPTFDHSDLVPGTPQHEEYRRFLEDLEFKLQAVKIDREQPFAITREYEKTVLGASRSAAHPLAEVHLDPDVAAVWSEMVSDHHRMVRFARKFAALTRRYGAIHRFPPEAIMGLMPLVNFAVEPADFLRYRLGFISLNFNLDPAEIETEFLGRLHLNLLLYAAMMRSGIPTLFLDARNRELLDKLDNRRFLNELSAYCEGVRLDSPAILILQRQAVGQFSVETGQHLVRLQNEVESLSKIWRMKRIPFYELTRWAYAKRGGKRPRRVAILEKYRGQFSRLVNADGVSFFNDPRRFLESLPNVRRGDLFAAEAIGPVGDFRDAARMPYPRLPDDPKEKLKTLALPNGERLFVKRVDFLRSGYIGQEMDDARRLDEKLQAADPRFRAQRFVAAVFDQGIGYLISAAAPGEPLRPEDKSHPDVRRILQILDSEKIVSFNSDERTQNILKDEEASGDVTYTVIDFESFPAFDWTPPETLSLIANLFGSEGKKAWLNWLLRLPLLGAIVPHELGHWIEGRLSGRAAAATEPVRPRHFFSHMPWETTGPPALAGLAANLIFAFASLGAAYGLIGNALQPVFIFLFTLNVVFAAAETLLSMLLNKGDLQQAFQSNTKSGEPVSQSRRNLLKYAYGLGLILGAEETLRRFYLSLPEPPAHAPPPPAQKIHAIYLFHDKPEHFENALPAFERVFDGLRQRRRQAIYVAELGGVDFDYLKERFPLLADIQKRDIFSRNPDPQKLERFHQAFLQALAELAPTYGMAELQISPEIRDINSYKGRFFRFLHLHRDRVRLFQHEALITAHEVLYQANLLLERHQMLMTEASIYAVQTGRLEGPLELVEQAARAIMDSVWIRDSAYLAGLQELGRRFPECDLVFERGISHSYTGLFERTFGERFSSQVGARFEDPWIGVLRQTIAVKEGRANFQTPEIRHLLLKVLARGVFTLALREDGISDVGQAPSWQEFYPLLNSLETRRLEIFFYNLPKYFRYAQLRNLSVSGELINLLKRIQTAEISPSSGGRVRSPATGWWAYPLNWIEEHIHWLTARLLGVPVLEVVVTDDDAYTRIPYVGQNPETLKSFLIAASAPFFWFALVPASAAAAVYFYGGMSVAPFLLSLFSGFTASLMAGLHWLGRRRPENDLYRVRYAYKKWRNPNTDMAPPAGHDRVYSPDGRVASPLHPLWVSDDPAVRRKWDEMNGENLRLWLFALKFTQLMRRHRFIGRFSKEEFEELARLVEFAGIPETLLRYRLGVITLNCGLQDNESLTKFGSNLVFNLILFVALRRIGMDFEHAFGDRSSGVLQILGEKSDLISEIHNANRLPEKSGKWLGLLDPFFSHWKIETVEDKIRLKEELLRLIVEVMPSKRVRLHQIARDLFGADESGRSIEPRIALAPEYRKAFEELFGGDGAPFMRHPRRFVERQESFPREDSFREIDQIRFVADSGRIVPPRLPGEDADKIRVFALPGTGEKIFAKRVDPVRVRYPEQEIDLALSAAEKLARADSRFGAQRFIGLFFDEGVFYLLSLAVAGEPLANLQGARRDEAAQAAHKMMEVLCEAGISRAQGEEREKEIFVEETGEGLRLSTVDFEPMAYEGLGVVELERLVHGLPRLSRIPEKMALDAEAAPQIPPKEAPAEPARGEVFPSVEKLIRMQALLEEIVKATGGGVAELFGEIPFVAPVKREEKRENPIRYYSKAIRLGVYSDLRALLLSVDPKKIPVKLRPRLRSLQRKISRERWAPHDHPDLFLADPRVFKMLLDGPLAARPVIARIFDPRQIPAGFLEEAEEGRRKVAVAFWLFESQDTPVVTFEKAFFAEWNPKAGRLRKKSVAVEGNGKKFLSFYILNRMMEASLPPSEGPTEPRRWGLPPSMLIWAFVLFLAGCAATPREAAAPRETAAAGEPRRAADAREQIEMQAHVRRIAAAAGEALARIEEDGWFAAYPFKENSVAELKRIIRDRPFVFMLNAPYIMAADEEGKIRVNFSAMPHLSDEELRGILFHEAFHFLPHQRQRAQLREKLYASLPEDEAALVAPGEEGDRHRRNLKRYMALATRNEVEAYLVQIVFYSGYADREKMDVRDYLGRMIARQTQPNLSGPFKFLKLVTEEGRRLDLGKLALGAAFGLEEVMLRMPKATMRRLRGVAAFEQPEAGFDLSRETLTPQDGEEYRRFQKWMIPWLLDPAFGEVREGELPAAAPASPTTENRGKVRSPIPVWYFLPFSFVEEALHWLAVQGVNLAIAARNLVFRASRITFITVDEFHVSLRDSFVAVPFVEDHPESPATFFISAVPFVFWVGMVFAAARLLLCAGSVVSLDPYLIGGLALGFPAFMMAMMHLVMIGDREADLTRAIYALFAMFGISLRSLRPEGDVLQAPIQQRGTKTGAARDALRRKIERGIRLRRLLDQVLGGKEPSRLLCRKWEEQAALSTTFSSWAAADRGTLSSQRKRYYREMALKGWYADLKELVVTLDMDWMKKNRPELVAETILLKRRLRAERSFAEKIRIVALQPDPNHYLAAEYELIPEEERAFAAWRLKGVTLGSRNLGDGEIQVFPVEMTPEVCRAARAILYETATPSAPRAYSSSAVSLPMQTLLDQIARARAAYETAL